MRKIPTLFVRDLTGRERLVLPTVTPGLEGVLAHPDDYRPTVKFDGTAAMSRNGKIFKRYDAKHGKPVPPNFEPCQEPDPATGHWPGWVPISHTDPADKWFFAAIDLLDNSRLPLANGTYELCGPKINGNPHKLPAHKFIFHGSYTIANLPLDQPTFDGLKSFLADFQWEGIVWWNATEPVCKLKRRDFGYPWPIKEDGS